MASTPAPGRSGLARRISRLQLLGRAFQYGTALVALGILALAATIAYVLVEGSSASFQTAGWGFLTSSTWDPTTGAFGAVPAIVGTFLVSGLALLFSVPVAIGAAVYIAEFAPRRWREALATVVDLSAAIPSIVYGLWGLLVVVPVMARYIEPFFVGVTGGRFLFSGEPLGLDIFTASIVLSLMMIPTISAFSRASLASVPRIQREASLSLGATRSEAVRMAVLGPAQSGIVAGVLLGFGRAIAEAIVVLMLSGNEFIIPSSLLSPGTASAAWIAGALGAAAPPERSALVEIGLILLVISVIVNVAARWVLSRFEFGRGHGEHSAKPGASPHTARLQLLASQGALPVDGSSEAPGPPGRSSESERVRSPEFRARRRRRRNRVYWGLVGGTVAATAIAIAPLVAIVFTAAVRGGRALITPGFYVDQPPPPCLPTECILGGIGPQIQGTLLLVALASLIALPLGILAGIYLSEYGRRHLGPVTSAVVNALTGLPTILIGVVIFVIFVTLYPDLTYSAITGTLALAILMLPIVVRATEEALKQVPQGLREAALALGFPRHRVALRVVLGTARTSVIIGAILAVARAGGETAALLYTAGWSTFYFQGFDHPVGTLPVFIFIYAQSEYPNWNEAAWGAALVLIIIMLAISVAARLTVRRSAGTAEAG